ncbi:oxidoreductase [Yoonia algicola]|uniref:Oxidoreductase n=1 Tax=Yoonia algicola TaxID=3137368 RepID=A0AAN0M546_9RHOB
MLSYVKKVVLVVSLAVASVSPAMAQQIEAPSGDVVLTVSGALSMTNDGDQLLLDLDMLMALPATTFETSTIWTEGVHQFKGVSLADFAASVGAEAGLFLATAINDYTVEIPFSDAVTGGPIIAYLMDGEAMSVRDKGPLWVIYPYDSNSLYRSEVVYSRSIWQLDRVEIVQ